VKQAKFKQSDLVLVGMKETWEHLLALMQLANSGVEGARHLADLVMARYFERLETKQ
jgi:hypothetical protein